MKRSAVLLAVGVTAGALGLLTAQEDRASSTEPHLNVKIQREGTRLDQKPLIFRTENDRLTVQFNDSSIQVLENLGAQRIFRANQDDPKDNQWLVTGILTEFEGRNYLLIEQAVRDR